MKLPSLLSQYLREHKKLSLPGIGIFHFTGQIPTIGDTPGLHTAHVQFENKKVLEVDDELINFIKKETGKIKPLALADLDCFLESGMQLLNIGKPFYIEGIGSIQRKKDGLLEFSTGEVLSVKVDHPAGHEHEKKASVFEEGKYEPQSNPMQRILAAGLLLAGMAVVLLGGYYLYNRSNHVNESDEQPHLNAAPPPVHADSTAIKPDSSMLVRSNGTYRFVLETTSSRRRAWKRYNQLKSMAIDVKMDNAPDSSSFKLYFIIPATVADTMRIKDSLNNYYGRRITIEQ